MNFDIGYEFLLPPLEFFAKATHSYGWAIILLTLAVRIVVWPLVVKSTQSMQRMAKLQPQLTALKERYKSEPEMFQRKSMEFFSKNKVNPMSGCWPLLVQMPILIALYATFTGPPFGDRVIDVKVNVIDKQQAPKVQQAQTSSNNSPYVSTDGLRAKLVVFPGESTIVAGESIDFGLRTVEGELSKEFVPSWKIVMPGNRNANDPGVAPESATIDKNGRATFLKPGEYHVQALVPGIAKNDRFFLINGLGKVARGAELLKPQNWDSLVLILLFGATMYLSQKYTVAAPKPAPNQELDEQQIIQQQTMKTMPIVTTAMFMFIPLPAGVLLYLVISNVFQTLQTLLIMRMPTPPLVDVVGGEGEQGGSPSGSPKPKGDKGPKPGGSDEGGPQGGSPNPKGGKSSAPKDSPSSQANVSTINGARASRGKRKAKRKKN